MAEGCAPQAPARLAGQGRDRGPLQGHLLHLLERKRIAMRAVCVAEWSQLGPQGNLDTSGRSLAFAIPLPSLASLSG